MLGEEWKIVVRHGLTVHIGAKLTTTCFRSILHKRVFDGAIRPEHQLGCRCFVTIDDIRKHGPTKQ